MNPNNSTVEKEDEDDYIVEKKVYSMQLSKGELLVGALIFVAGYVIGHVNGRMSIFNQFMSRD